MLNDNSNHSATNAQPLVTVLVPHYKTLALTQLCLRLLRKYTDPTQIHTIVIDNDSNDASLDYLRGLRWIELIERPAQADETPPLAHSRALDLGLARVKTPYVLSIHTDTFVKHPEWLNFLMSHIDRSPNIAGVGSWKLEMKSPWQHALKTVEHTVQSLYYRLIGKAEHALEGVGKNYYYLRSHCALYRTEFLKQYALTFSDEADVAGKVMHRKLIENGHRMVFLKSAALIRYLDHVNHATLILNPSLDPKQRTSAKGLRRLKKNLAQFDAEGILNDARWDE